MKAVCIVSLILSLLCVPAEAWVKTQKVFYITGCQERHEEPDPKALNRFDRWQTFFDKLNDIFEYVFLASFGWLLYQRFGGLK